MKRRPGGRPGVLLLAVVAAITVAVSGLGLAAALGSQVVKGSGESGQGSLVAQKVLTYWGWASTVVGTIPAAVPGAVSHTAATPTRLPRLVGAGYAINAATGGQTAVVWSFTETTAAPRSTEFVITFVDGLGGATTSTINAYLETNARALTVALTYVFYWDAGTVAPSGLEISTMTVTVQQCTAIGVCP